MALTYRGQLNRPLTSAEIDANFAYFTGSYSVTGSITISSGSSSPLVLPVVSASLDFADDTAAAAGGVPLGGIYRNGNVLSIRIS